MTREEDIQQRINWAMYLLPADSEVTREIVKAIIRVDQSPAKLGDAAPWTHRYSVLRCPKCDNDLTAESGCCIEGCREGFKPTLAPSQLNAAGVLDDAFDIIADGDHSDTLCGKCGESLCDYEI